MDDIAERGDELQYEAFQKTISTVLLKHEKLDGTKNKIGWIEVFLDEYKSLVSSLLLERKFKEYVALPNSIKIVSLNYDRVIHHHFQSRLELRHIRPQAKRQAIIAGNIKLPEPHVEIFQPHGAIATLPNINNSNHTSVLATPIMSLGYGDDEQLFRIITLGKPWQSNIISAVEADLNGQGVYPKAKHHCGGAQNIICIGLSPDGINNSQLSFNNTKRLIMTNSETDLSKINSGKIKNSDIFGSPDGLHAYELISRLTNKSTTN